VEVLGVDAARNHAQAAEAAGREVAAQGLGRHHRAQRRVVELAQVSHDGLAQPPDAIVLAVGVEVGAEIRGHRQLQVPAGLQRRPAQGAFGGDVDDVRSAQRPQAHQRAFGRHAHAQVTVARDRQAAHQHLVETLALLPGIGAGLARAHQLHVVLAQAQAFDQARQRHRHAVDFRRIGLGDDRHSQRPARRRELVDFEIALFAVLPLHERIVVRVRNSSMTA